MVKTSRRHTCTLRLTTPLLSTHHDGKVRAWLCCIDQLIFGDTLVVLMGQSGITRSSSLLEYQRSRTSPCPCGINTEKLWFAAQLFQTRTNFLQKDGPWHFSTISVNHPFKLRRILYQPRISLSDPLHQCFDLGLYPALEFCLSPG